MISGSLFLVYIDTDTPKSAGSGSNYRPVVCGTDNNFGIESESIEYRNKNDDGWLKSYAGYNSASLDMSGYAVGLKMDEKLTQANFNEVALLIYNKKEFWLMQKDDEDRIVRSGWSRCTSFRETASLDQMYSFTASFVYIGKPFLGEAIIKLIRSTNEQGTELRQDGNNNLIEIKNG